MSDMISKIEPVILMALSAVSGLTQETAEKFGSQLGDQLNDMIEGSETMFDDYAKVNALIPFLQSILSELEVEGVDD